MKCKNWERVLIQAIMDSHSTKFEWGISDCIMWSAGILEKYTGIDIAAEFRGTYNTEEEVFNILKEKNLYTRICEKLGKPIDNINFVMRGDLVMSNKNEAGICIGQRAAFLTKDEGPTFYNISDCKYAWKVD